MYVTSDSTVTISDDFQGVVYAPGADLEIEDDVTIDGAVVAGDATALGDDVGINFDTSLRSATPLSDEDEVSFQYGSRKPFDMTVVLDRSGSMRRNDPSRQRVEATKNVIDRLDADIGDRIGIYDFDSSGRVLYPLGEDLETARERVVGAADGSTNMASGLRLALEDYEEHGTDDRERIVILLSDGRNTVPFGDLRMDYQIRRAVTLDATVHTVGLGDDDSIPTGKLERWANETGGNFYQTTSPEQLRDIFPQITEEEFDTGVDSRIEVSVTHDRETTSDHAVRISERTVEIDG